MEQNLLVEKRKLLRERSQCPPLVVVQRRAPGSDEREAYIVHTQRTQVGAEQPSQNVARYLQRAGVGMRLLAERVVDVHVVDHDLNDPRLQVLAEPDQAEDVGGLMIYLWTMK